VIFGLSARNPERSLLGFEGASETEGGGMAPDTGGLVPDIPVILRKIRRKKKGKQKLNPETAPLGIEHSLDTPDLLQKHPPEFIQQPPDLLSKPPDQIGQPQQFPDPRLGKDRK
jgi:hypothetical protein